MNRTKEWNREYMRQWRKKNAAKVKAYRSASKEYMREYLEAYKCRGDGFDVDLTDFVPETPRQAAMWRQLLGAS